MQKGEEGEIVGDYLTYPLGRAAIAETLLVTLDVTLMLCITTAFD